MSVNGPIGIAGRADRAAPDPADSPGAAVHDLVVLCVRYLAGGRDLSLTAASVLSTLDRVGPQRITALAAREDVSQPSMTQLVQRLELRGLVARAADPADGRAALASITPAGHAALLARRRASAGRLDDLLDRLPADRLAALTDAVRTALPDLHAHADGSNA
jgi:DNA-binding MarR family transcriptional regulator